jgi:hypothetical protein
MADIFPGELHMGRYFNPATEQAIIEAGGRPLDGPDHPSLSAQLSPGESLAMFGDRLMFKQVADVTSPREFEEFEGQYRRGGIVSRSFYAMPADAFRG